MGVCKPERVKLVACGDGHGGSKGRRSCASTGLDEERMIAREIEQGECSRFCHIIILFIALCRLIPARPFTQHRSLTKRGRLHVESGRRSAEISMTN